jgi:hypothetical protein
MRLRRAPGRFAGHLSRESVKRIRASATIYLHEVLSRLLKGYRVEASQC